MRVAIMIVCVGEGAFHVARSPEVIAWSMNATYVGRDGVIRQRAGDDCGIAALEMVLVHFGLPVDLDSALQSVRSRRRGLSFQELRELGAARGLATSGWSMDIPRLLDLREPSIVHLPGHYVVLDSVRSDGTVWIRDPASGRLRMSVPAFQRQWTGRVLLLEPPASRPHAHR